MKFFFFSSGYRFAQAIALLIIGMIIGAVIATVAIGHQVDRLHSQNNQLTVKLGEREEQIKTLEEKVAQTQRWLTVQEIEVHVELPERNFADKNQLQLELEKQGWEMLRTLRGKRLMDLDPQVIWQIAHQRKVEASGYSFVLEVKSLLVSEKLVIYIYAHYLDPKDTTEPVFY